MLGQVQFVPVADNLVVANMIGQHGIRRQGAIPPIRYQAVHECLQRVAHYATQNRASVHMPQIGCGLAGGDWDHIEPLIEDTLIARQIPVTIYDLS